MTLLQHEVQDSGSATGEFLDFLNEFLFLLLWYKNLRSIGIGVLQAQECLL
jgi:hypothetical protein